MKDFKHENPENWKWGIFYFNKEDSRLIVAKRNQMMGWTFNFAHPVSYVMVILIICIPLYQYIFT